MPQPVLEALGRCPACDQDVVFRAEGAWLRDQFLCPCCRSIPRERALMRVIEMYHPDFRRLDIHEAGPVARGASVKLKREVPGYVVSQYDTRIPFGEQDRARGHRSEDLESQTFADASFDLVVTPDVLEHVFEPERAFREIGRTLRPGGAHVFTTPLVRKHAPSQRRAARGKDGVVVHLFPAEYHGNPMDPGGALVTFHWGYDICRLIFECSGMWTTIVAIDDLRFGIRAEYLEVLVSRKP
jgi:SAM-dependent methyltransferase